jgi:basic amino acid/polyamine antiporter, APA family
MSYTKASVAAGKAPTTITEPTYIPAPSEPASRPADRLTLVGATALVVGSIVGVGIFNLPSSLAPYGPITSYRWG